MKLKVLLTVVALLVIFANNVCVFARPNGIPPGQLKKQSVQAPQTPSVSHNPQPQYENEQRKDPASSDELESQEGSEHEELPSSSPSCSCSSFEQKGKYRIHVVGTGKKCIIKTQDKDFTNKQNCGYDILASGYLDLFGDGECEDNGKGNAMATIEGSVLAAACNRGPECFAKVLSSFETQFKENPVHKGVSANVGGTADGDALAICD